MTCPGASTVYALAFQFAAVTVIGPLAEVFDEMGLLLFLMGMLGGLTGHFAIRQPFRIAFYPAIVGGMLGFGLGIIAPPLLKSFFAFEIMAETSSVRGIASVSYLLGLLHERVLAKLRGEKEPENGDDNAE